MPALFLLHPVSTQFSTKRASLKLLFLVQQRRLDHPPIRLEVVLAKRTLYKEKKQEPISSVDVELKLMTGELIGSTHKGTHSRVQPGLRRSSGSRLQGKRCSEPTKLKHVTTWIVAFGCSELKGMLGKVAGETNREAPR